MSVGRHSVVCWTFHVLEVQPSRLLDLPHRGGVMTSLTWYCKNQRSARSQRPSSKFEQRKKKRDLQSGQIRVSCSACFFSLPADHFNAMGGHWTEDVEFIRSTLQPIIETYSICMNAEEKEEYCSIGVLLANPAWL